MSSRRLFLWLIGVAVFIAAPHLFSEYHLFQIGLVASTAIIVLGLTVVTGIAGQISLAQAAFAAFGAYGMTLLAINLGISPWFGIPLSATFTALVGYILGMASFRVAGHYLALTTLAFTVVVNLVLLNWESVTGGAIGLYVMPLSIGDFEITSGRELYYLIIPVTVVMFLFVQNMVASRFGRALSALRQSEVAADMLGIHLLHYKALAFAISAFCGAIGGALQALQTTYLDPNQYDIALTVYFVAVLVIGGLRNPLGPIVGSVIFIFAPELLGGFESYLGLMFALLLLLVIIFFPRGIAGFLSSIVFMRPMMGSSWLERWYRKS